MLVTETFHGFIESTQDVLLIFEGCRRGLLPRICRRLQEKERKMIQSGSVFVFDERESGIKRWTDGRMWSPSRILGNFLIYRELDKRNPGEKRHSTTATSAAAAGDMRQRSYSADHSAGGSVSPVVDRGRERQLVGSLSDTYKFRKDGLIKKTMSIVVNGVAQHLISYYHPNDVLQGSLRTPSSVPELAGLEISPELLVKQNFRIPPMVESALDHNPNDHTGISPLTPPDSFGDRRMHQLRSMSVGSLRAGTHEMPGSHFMYPYRMDGDQKYPSTLPMYNPGYAMPSPTSMTSSPSTPMLSPGRPTFHHRHYSTSSYPRNYNPPDVLSYPSQTDTSAGFFNNGDSAASAVKSERPDSSQSNANLGQLLNPVHPLHHPEPPQSLFNSTQSYQGYTASSMASDRHDSCKPLSTTPITGSSAAAPSVVASSNATSSHSPVRHSSVSGATDSQAQASGGSSIDMDGYMYYHHRQQSLNNSHHFPDQAKNFVNPYFSQYSLHNGEMVETELANGTNSLMLK